MVLIDWSDFDWCVKGNHLANHYLKKQSCDWGTTILIVTLKIYQSIVLYLPKFSSLVWPVNLPAFRNWRSLSELIQLFNASVDTLKYRGLKICIKHFSMVLNKNKNKRNKRSNKFQNIHGIFFHFTMMKKLKFCVIYLLFNCRKFTTKLYNIIVLY